MNNKLLLLPAALAAIFSMNVQAGAVTWNDVSYEVLIRPDGTAATSFLVGDILVGVVGITTYTGPSPVINNLNGIFATQVTGIIPYTGPLNYFPCNGGITSLTSCAAITFGPVGTVAAFTDPSYLNNYVEAVTSAFGSFGATVPTITNTDGNTVVTWFDSTSIMSSTNITQTFNSIAPSGSTQVATLNMIGSSDYWFANGPTDLSQVQPLATGTPIGLYGFQNTLYWQNFPLAMYAANAKFTATGGIGSNGNTAGDPSLFFIKDVTFISSTTAVPEPSILALFGLGLIGAGLFKKKSLNLIA